MFRLKQREKISNKSAMEEESLAGRLLQKEEILQGQFSHTFQQAADYMDSFSPYSRTNRNPYSHTESIESYKSNPYSCIGKLAGRKFPGVEFSKAGKFPNLVKNFFLL